ncbi:hypothetical protein EJV46_19815 [Roseococcus sp. SYP-B2431]|uniref:hypothetical protein n=1 Tax=Roseococcus sp. SYP-B2431 TaxID=2496640 RepID=UPI00103F8298|nr:hypothetical protein [Roseococcus sp. SYP-B2431]TCH96820.1 hypothetical protein EJV46_19815 [Roseococcus sp. SYP-B2431]
MADVVEGRRPPGDAEAIYRDALPEELRYWSRPKTQIKAKAKPGKATRIADSSDITDGLGICAKVEKTP